MHPHMVASFLALPYVVYSHFAALAASRYSVAIGTKRTSPSALHMSAVGGKADMTFCTANVRL